MNYKELVSEVRLLDDFQEDKQCIDGFTEDTAKDLKNLSSADQKFIIDALYGCNMHKKLLDVVVSIFYNHHGKKLFRVDRNLFIVVCYLAMFCLDDLGLEHFSRIIKSLDISKMHKFLSFFFNISNLTTHIQREWSHIYDAAVAENHCVMTFFTFDGKIMLIVAFACLLPQVPATTHRTPNEPEILDEMKQSNRQKALQILNEANSQQFRCANPQKSEKTQQNTISQILQSRDAELQFDKLYASGSISIMNSLPVRLNTTAILREGALYNRVPQGSICPFKDQISHEEAVLARERVLERNHHKAQQTKEETTELMRKYAEKHLKEEKEMRELVQQVAGGHKNSKAAKAKLQEIKQRIGTKEGLTDLFHSQEEKRMRSELREAVSRDERVLKNEQVLPLTVKTTLNKKQVLEEQHWQELEHNFEQQIYRTFQQSSKKNGALYKKNKY
uniref:Cilia and flagella associated protein 99 n=1 Tax=Sinocyclocheilus anshuiensis TaxID=1608454 RepID=A0A671NPV5_9TELE